MDQKAGGSTDFYLGRILAEVEASNRTSQQIREDVKALRAELQKQGEEHDTRLRELEKANPAGLAGQLKTQADRITVLEHMQIRIGVWASLAGLAGSVAITELIRRMWH